MLSLALILASNCNLVSSCYFCIQFDSRLRLGLTRPRIRCPATTQTRSTPTIRLPPPSPTQGGPRTGHERDAEYQVLAHREKETTSWVAALNGIEY
jgi:hypothetical protein